MYFITFSEPMCKCFRIWTFVWKNWYSDEPCDHWSTFYPPPPLKKREHIVFHLSVRLSLDLVFCCLLKCLLDQMLFAQYFWPSDVHSVSLTPLLEVAKLGTLDAPREKMTPIDFEVAWSGRSKFRSLKKCCLLNISWPLCLKVAKLSTVDTNRE